MSTFNIETWQSNGTWVAAFVDRKDRADFMIGLGSSEWLAVEDFARKKAQGMTAAKGTFPAVGHKLEE
jgi:hypothetical protein